MKRVREFFAVTAMRPARTTSGESPRSLTRNVAQSASGVVIVVRGAVVATAEARQTAAAPIRIPTSSR